MEKVKHQQCFLQTFGSHRANFFVIEQIDQRFDVVTTDHGAQQFGGLGFADQRYFDIAVCNSRQKRSFHFGCIVNTWGDTVCQQVQQKCVFTLRRIFDQFDQLRSLFCIQRQRWDSQSSAFSGVFTIGFQHGFLLSK